MEASRTKLSGQLAVQAPEPAAPARQLPPPPLGTTSTAAGSASKAEHALAPASCPTTDIIAEGCTTSKLPASALVPPTQPAQAVVAPPPPTLEAAGLQVQAAGPHEPQRLQHELGKENQQGEAKMTQQAGQQQEVWQEGRQQQQLNLQQQQQQTQQRRQQVVLRVEVATKLQARLLTWSVIVLNTIFILLAFALLGLHSKTGWTLGQLRPLYRAQLILACICLGVLLYLLYWAARSVRRSIREQRIWSKRQAFFGRTVAVMMLLVTLYSAAYVASVASIVAQPDCRYPWIAMAALEFVQWTIFSCVFFFLVARLYDLTLWRGQAALDMDPDYMLVVDRPLADRARARRLIFGLWLLLEAAAVVKLVGRIIRYSNGGNKVFTAGCDENIDDISCETTPYQIASAVVGFVLISAFVALWGWVVHRSLKDHEQLPYCRYRATHIFVRVQARVIGPVLGAVVIAVLVLSVVPTFRDNCFASGNSQAGNLPVQLSLTVAAAVLGIMYMPTARAVDSPLLQEFLQDFSWTQADVAADVEKRNQRLMASEAAYGGSEGKEGALTEVVAFLPGMLTAGIARLTGVPDVASAAAQLRREPIFCMETAVRLFYWARLAYREDSDSTDKFVNTPTALRLFDLDHYEAIWDDTTDTHCVLGWSGSQVVVAFRGTASVQNALTDLKAWKVPLSPERRRHGQLLQVHAGFNNAWVHRGFNNKVLAKLQEIEAAAQGTTPLRFWITGHSLGGALAVLASLDISRQHPHSTMTCYTWGTPRVGNGAFAGDYNEAVPDTWAIVNGLDPIPWIPKVGFKRVGKRVTIDAKGNLILRPTYFELSVTHRGTSAKHHMTGSYALSLAAIMKAQFMTSKQLPGGASGVEQLAAAVDLATCLVLTKVDLASLKDPQQLPQLAEALAAKEAKETEGVRAKLLRRVAAPSSNEGKASAATGRCYGCGCCELCCAPAQQASSPMASGGGGRNGSNLPDEAVSGSGRMRHLSNWKA